MLILHSLGIVIAAQNRGFQLPYRCLPNCLKITILANYLIA